MVKRLGIPTYAEMFLPTLRALWELGGSGTKDEVDEAVIRLMGLSDEQVALEFSPDATQTGSKVIHRLAWARTYLKKFDAVDNSERGVWTLEPEGRRYLDMDPAEADQLLRTKDSEARRELRARRLARRAASSAVPTLAPVEPIADESDEDEAGDWKLVLLAQLKQLTPQAFERLAQRLLREAGFKNVEVLGRSGDGGIDGVGLYRPSLVSFPIFFQCKRYADSVGSAQVRDFRGAMAGRGEKGLLITTGRFTAEAKKEASRDGAPLVELIEGDDLCDLLKQFQVGVVTRIVEEVDIDAAYFRDL